MPPFTLPDNFAATLQVHLTGRWRPAQVKLVTAASTYLPTAETEALIESAWSAAKARLGDKLFDGAMCRFEQFAVDADGGLTIALSRTSYRVFLGTNMARPTLPAEQRGNPVGVSSGLVTADGFFMLGRRSGNVAYYPHKLHPFAGSLEPGDPLDLFAQARRELHEELSIDPSDLSELTLLGIVEDLRLRHPETILRARTRLPRAEVERRMDRHEHAACWACRDTPAELAAAMERERDELTPVGLASLALHAADR